MKFKLLIILHVIFLTGCVGAFHSGPENKIIENPDISKGKDERLYFESEKAAHKKDLISKWGKPNSVKIKGDTEEWRYILDSKISNSTLLVVGVIPIPINLPDEAETVTFTIKNNMVVKADTKFEAEKGGVCGFHMTQHFGTEFGCTK